MEWLKNNRSLLLSLLSLVVAIISAWISFSAFSREKYSDSASFSVVENLWDSKEPSFALINESTKKLSQLPYHTYLMLIPSKILWHSKDGTVSSLILSPVSYQTILDQKDYYQTTGKLEKSILPKQFFAKKGTRDIVKSKKFALPDSDIKCQIITYPMLLIITPINYKYIGDKNFKHIILASTSIDKKEISPTVLKNLKNYIKDNSDLEVKVNGNESVYQTANNQVLNKFKGMVNEKDKDLRFIGGKKGGYNNVLKYFNELITPHDPME